MGEILRPTREVVYLIDVDDEKPNSGEMVYALGLGGSLCPVVWTRTSHEFFKAWMPYPKVPKKVKEKLAALYDSGKSWGKHGTEVQREGAIPRTADAPAAVLVDRRTGAICGEEHGGSQA